MIDPVSGAGGWPPPAPSAARAPAEVPPAAQPEPPQLGLPGPPISSAEAIARYLGVPAERSDANGTDLYV